MDNCIGGMKMYDVYCSECEWSEYISINKNDILEEPGILSKLLGCKIPSKIPKTCPKCQSKTEKREANEVEF